MDKVSVVIPAYNRARLLPRAIGSALAQTLPPHEVIVVDDRSTDETRQLLEEWVRRDPRIVPVFQEVNQGPGGARNRGVTEATGEFVAFLDSDDEWCPTHLRDCAAPLREDSTLDLIFADLRRVRNSGEVIDEAFLRESKQIGQYLTGHSRQPGCFVFKLPEAQALLRQYCVPIQTTLIRREVARAFPFDAGIRGPEDYDFCLRLALARKRFGYVDRVHCTCYIHDQNLYSNRTAPMRECTEEMKVWTKIAGNQTYDASVRRHAREELSRLLFDLGYAYYRQGMKGASLAAYARSLWRRFSLHTIKALFVSLVTPGIMARRGFATGADG